MKRIIIKNIAIIILWFYIDLVFIVSAFGGFVFIDNIGGEFKFRTAPFYDDQGRYLEGTNYVSQLYIGYSPDVLFPWGPLVPFDLPGFPGYVAAQVDIPTPEESTPPIWVQIRAWDNTDGSPSHEQAVLNGAWTGVNDIYLLDHTGTLIHGGVPYYIYLAMLDRPYFLGRMPPPKQVEPPPAKEPLDQWTWRSAFAQGYGLNHTAYGSGLWVACGNQGKIMTSPDAVNWTSQNSGTNLWFGGIAHGQGTFVLVGDYGTILTSADGTNWSRQISGAAASLQSITYGNGRFVAVGARAILSSADGITWHSSTSDVSTNLMGVVWAIGLFVAVGDGGTILTSPDGLDWTPRTSGINNMLCGIACGNNTLVAVAEAGKVVTSSDGVTWTAHPSGLAYGLNGIAFGNGTFVAAGGCVMASVHWTRRTEANFFPLNGVAFANGQFVVVGDPVLTSPDGVRWSMQTFRGNSESIMTFENGRFAGTAPWSDVPMVRRDDLSKLRYNSRQVPAAMTYVLSADGIKWWAGIPVENPPPAAVTNALHKLAYALGLYVSVDEAGAILTSSDKTNWVQRNSGTTNALGSVIYGGGRFLAVGDQGGISTSPDGLVWTAQASGRTNNLRNAAFGEGYYVVVGYRGTILTSTNGSDWTVRFSGTGSDLTGIAYGAGCFVASGGGLILQSGFLTPPGIRLGGLTMQTNGYFGGTLAAKPGYRYKIQVSSDLIQWLDLTNITATATNQVFTDFNQRVSTRRFYRAVLP